MSLRSALLSACLLAGVTANPAFADFHWSPELEAATNTRIEAGEFGTVTSVLVLSGGEPVYEAYFNGADASTLHNTRSVTKTITGMLVGLAVADGALDPEAPLAPLFAAEQPFENDHPAKHQINAIDLMTMSGPMECDDWNQFSRGNEERMYIVEDWPSFYWDLPLRGFPSWVTPPSEAQYGRSHSYCTAGVQILGEAVQRATGRDIRSYAETRLLEPLGVTDVGWPETGSGRIHLGGGLELSAQSLAAFGELQRLGGVYAGQRILPEAWTVASVEPHTVIEGPGFEYGYLWWLQDRETAVGTTPVAMMNGNGGNRVWVIDEHDLTIVLTKTDFGTATMHREAMMFFQEIIAPNVR